MFNKILIGFILLSGSLSLGHSVNSQNQHLLRLAGHAVARFDRELLALSQNLTAAQRRSGVPDFLTNSQMLAEPYSELLALRALSERNQLGTSNAALETEVKSLAKALREEWAASEVHPPRQTKDRLNPEERYQILPSLSQKGNLTGSQFPPGSWAVSYDDGPHTTRSEELLQVWRGEAKPSFFWLGENMQRRTGFVRELAQQGYLINSHSFDHPDLSRAGASQRTRQIDTAVGELHSLLSAAGAPLARSFFFRLPYGAGTRDADLRQRFLNLKLVHAFWNVDSLDWQDRDPQVIFQRTRRQMEVAKQGLILFHDIHAQSVAASRLLVDYFRSHRSRWQVRELKTIVDEINGKPLENILQEMN